LIVTALFIQLALKKKSKLKTAILRNNVQIAQLKFQITKNSKHLNAKRKVNEDTILEKKRVGGLSQVSLNINF
jgi:hypothetical protein